jgi:signal transduction histidine kinase
MERDSRSGRLQKKFFVALLIAGIVPGVAALVATYLYSITSLKQSIGSSFQEIARSTAIRLAAAVDTEIDRAVQLASLPLVIRRPVEAANERYRGKTEAEIRQMLDAEAAAWKAGTRRSHAATSVYLQDWMGENAHYARVVIADRHGATIASTDPTVPYLSADQEWWQEVFEDDVGSAYVSSLRLDPGLNDYTFQVAVPILSRDRDEPVGAVGLVIRREVLMNTILPIRVGNTGHGMLLDTEGTPLICPVLPPTAHLIHDALLNQLAHDRPLWLVAENDAHGGHNSIVGSAPVKFVHRLSTASLGGERWFAFVRQQPEETYAPIWSLLVRVGLIGLALVLALATLGLLMGRRIVAPILLLRQEAETLRRTVMALPEGRSLVPENPQPPLEIQTGDEIEDLAKTFQAMRAGLEESLRTVKSQQEELIRREKLASVGQLLAALAHDLRNPLGVIRTSAQLVLEQRQSEEVKREVARYIMDEVDRLTHRINDFLRYARQKPPELKRLSLNDVARAAAWQWKAYGRPEGLEVTTSLFERLPHIRVDPEQVKEALVNLLMNAGEAMPEGGQIVVTTRLGDGGQCEIEVADTGVGISAPQLERIFEPFFTTKEYGTGLGLTNVKRLIQDNGGTIEVHSEPGRGTRFVVRFPAVDETTAESVEHTAAGRPLELGQPTG